MMCPVDTVGSPAVDRPTSAVDVDVVVIKSESFGDTSSNMANKSVPVEGDQAPLVISLVGLIS